ncbi:MAG: hypothetical protein J6O56_01370 [Bacilli bacterium]|nr:hypothetical protein [Bacilli bacterium]
MRIGIDIADTIIDVWPTIMKRANEFNEKYIQNEITSEKWVYLPEHYYGWDSEQTKKFWDLYRENVTFSAPLNKYVYEALDEFKKIGIEIYFITAKTNEEYKNLENSIINLLGKYNLPYDKIIVQAENKGKICNDNDIVCLIDDSFDNCSKANFYDIDSILINKPYNLGRECIGKMKRAEDFLEVSKQVKKLINR